MKKKVDYRSKFSIDLEYREGFQEHVALSPDVAIDEQHLRRLRLFYRKRHPDQNSPDLAYIKKIIQHNASLRVTFGWSFESTTMLKQMFDDCMNEVIPHFERQLTIPHMVTDFRADWFGFVAYNTFEQIEFEDLDLYQLILANNSLIDFQIDVLKYIVQHPLYLDHAICRDVNYRYKKFKQFRNDPGSLEDMFKRYLNAQETTSGITRLPMEIIEQDVGVHFLKYPDLFFELVDFYSLKGTIYE